MLDKDILVLVAYEDFFDVLLAAHKKIGHKARDLMNAECSQRHLNITIDLIRGKKIIIN